MPDFSFELKHGRDAAKVICGVDEVGRGPLAGPVVAAAAVIPLNFPEKILGKIKDSKLMTAQQREEIFELVSALCPHTIAQATVAEIDTLNILHASMLAMSRAVRALKVSPDHVLVDGNRSPRDLPCPATPVVGGDAKSYSIAAASIIAKVTRDRMMTELAEQHPGYGWESNMGYGTAQHLESLQRLGATEWHRDSFAPVSKRIRSRA